MEVTIGEKKLIELLERRLWEFLLEKEESDCLQEMVPVALDRTQGCFREMTNKYYRNGFNDLVFNPFHSAQNSIFLYFLSNSIWKAGNAQLADKVYCLNKMLASFDLFYEVEMPEVFFLDHPVGTVIGRASIGNYLVFQQNCTLGANKGVYPVVGEFVWLFAGATIIGRSIIGNNVFVSAGSFIKDEQIPDNTIVFGSSPRLTLKRMPAEFFLHKSPFRIHHRRIPMGLTNTIEAFC